MLSPTEEMGFWTGILRDHGEFIVTSLAYTEQEAITQARYYKESFAFLHEQSKKLMETNSPEETLLLAGRCMALLVNFINFKKILLRRSLTCKLDTSLPPTFFNHMINEAAEFYRILCHIQVNTPVNPLLENLNLHLIWLPDAAGHAATIAADLDPSEYLLVKEAHEFQKHFNSLSLKAQELEKMLMRTCLDDGSLSRLNEEVKMKVGEFISYLEKVRELRLECRIMGTLKPLIPDHMIREETYYLCNAEASLKALEAAGKP